MSISEIVQQRGIEEILHFTTNLGLTGILASGNLLARSALPDEKHLRYIVRYNCVDRSKDSDWHDHVNLSITSINNNLFGISTNRWHADLKQDGWWCILSFSSEILSHDGVYFATTNNMYWNGVKRGQGPDNLNSLFAKKVLNFPGRYASRSLHTADNQPTCNQAEVLYPQSLSLEYLRRIYLRTDKNAAHVEALLGTFEKTGIEVEVKPEIFIN